MTTTRHAGEWDACTVVPPAAATTAAPSYVSEWPDRPPFTRCTRCHGQGREPSAIIRAVLRWGPRR